MAQGPWTLITNIENEAYQAAKQANDSKEQRALLQSILIALNNSTASKPDAPVTPRQDYIETMNTSDGEHFNTSDQANLLSQMYQTGGPAKGAAGNDS
jgi:hypothetical protein